MNTTNLERLASALVYDEYSFDPTRRVMRNGATGPLNGIFPRCWSEESVGRDSWHVRANVLVEAHRASTLHINVRFLHAIDCCVVIRKQSAWEPVERLVVDNACYQTQHEYRERSVELTVTINELLTHAVTQTFTFADQPSAERMFSRDGRVRGAVIRRQTRVRGTIMASAAPAGNGAWLIVISVANDSHPRPIRTPHAASATSNGALSRDAASLQAFGALHVVVRSEEGQFISAIHPAPEHRATVDEARSDGLWPVLLGMPGSRDAMLCSQVILPDYPQMSGDGRDAQGAMDGELRAGAVDEARRLRLIFEEREFALRARALELANGHSPTLHGAMRVCESNVQSVAH